MAGQRRRAARVRRWCRRPRRPAGGPARARTRSARRCAPAAAPRRPCAGAGAGWPARGRAWCRQGRRPRPAAARACRLPPRRTTSGRAASASAQAASAALARTWSQASISTSTGIGSSAGPVVGLHEVVDRVHLGSRGGCRRRVRPAPALGLAQRAAQRLHLAVDVGLGDMVQVEQHQRSATPLRASASTAHEPTPPRPTTATRAARRRA
jgi:hypothetical protein